jgi:DUF1365 family protein
MDALYAGKVFHARMAPKRHRLSYRIFMVLTAVGGERGGLGFLYGRNRPGLISVWDKDHGDGSARPLRVQIEAMIAARGLAVPAGPMRMLSMPRVLGRAFNPLTVYYCHDAAGRLAVVVYEVNNTFGARHWYVLPADRQHCGKAFFVSPFMDMDLAYDFQIAAPGERALIGIRVSREGETVLTASFAAERRALNAANILLAWAAHPLQTLGVLAGIYLEGLKLLLKGLRWRSPKGVRAAREPAGAV